MKINVLERVNLCGDIYDYEIHITEIISKKDITKEWLEEKCELEKYSFPALDNEKQLCEECNGEITSLSDKYYICKCFEKYKCFEDYEVEIK